MNQEGDHLEVSIANEISKLNYKVVRKMEDDLKDIKYIASYCSVYELDKSIRIWHACDMAGPLYLVTRKKATSMKMIILNQKSPFDFEEEITAGQRFELNLKEQMIFFQNNLGVVKGLWMNNNEDLTKVYKYVSEYCSK